MASPSIASRYAIYKEGTSKIVKWLSDTACRCSPDLAKLSAHQITTKDIKTFASIVTNADPAVKIPGAVVELLLDVIAGRQFCADWYTTQPSTSADPVPEGDQNKTRNETHQFFIDALQHVCDTLKVARKKQQQEATRAKVTHHLDLDAKLAAQEDAKDSMLNLFAQLELEEAAEDGLDAHASANPSKAAPQSPENTYENLIFDEEAEKEFVLWCYLQDCQDLRTHVQGVWRDYQAGELSFLAASCITDTAFGIMRRADNGLIAKYPDFKDTEAIYACVGVRAGLLKRTEGSFNEPILVLAETGQPLPAGSRCANNLSAAAETLMRTISHLWKSARQPTEQQAVKIAPQEKQANSTEADHACNDERPKTSEVKISTPLDSSDRISALVAFHPFAVELFRANYEIFVMTESSAIKDMDEFVRGMVELRHSHNVRMWLVQACRIYMDVFETLGSQGSQGLLCWKSFLSDAEHTFHNYLSATDRLQLPSGLQDLMRSIRDHTKAELAMASNMASVRISVDKPSTGTLVNNEISRWIPSEVFKTLPLSPGERLRNAKTTMHVAGVDIIDVRRAVLSMAHIYKAALHYGLLQETWQDMDWLIDEQSKQRPLIPELGPGVDEMALTRHFLYAMGMPPSAMFCDDARRLVKAITAHKMKERLKQIKSSSPFLQATIDEYDNENRLSCSGSETIEKILHSMQKQRKAVPKTRDRANKPPSQVTGSQLFSTYQQIFTESEPEIHFDYLGLYVQCLNTIDAMKNAAAQRLPKLFRDIPHESNFVAYLLSDIGNRKRSSRSLENSALQLAVAVLKQHIASHGDEKTKAAYQQSSGHIPREAHPAFRHQDLNTSLVSPNEQIASEQADFTEAEANNVEDEGVPEHDRNQGIENSLAMLQQAFVAQKKKRGRRLLRTKK